MQRAWGRAILGLTWFKCVHKRSIGRPGIFYLLPRRPESKSQKRNAAYRGGHCLKSLSLEHQPRKHCTCDRCCTINDTQLPGQSFPCGLTRCTNPYGYWHLLILWADVDSSQLWSYSDHSDINNIALPASSSQYFVETGSSSNFVMVEASCVNVPLQLPMASLAL